MTAPFDPFGLLAERARVRKVFGLPEPKTPFDLEIDAWAVTEQVMLGSLLNWQPTGLIQALGDDGAA